MTFDKELLFKSTLPEGEVEIPGKGTVRVRALTRAEALSIQKVTGGVEMMERKMLALALVDPVLTEAEVGKWQQASTVGEMEPIGKAIQALSGMTEGAAKEAYTAFDEDPDAEFRLPAG